jgi:hypothetical protein
LTAELIYKGITRELLARTRDASFFAGFALALALTNSPRILAPFCRIRAAAARYPASIIPCPQGAAYASLSSSASSSTSLKLRSPVKKKKVAVSDSPLACQEQAPGGFHEGEDEEGGM